MIMAPRPRGLLKSVHTSEQLAFRELMIAARKRAELTQQELANRLHRPQSFIAKYENGERRLDVVEFIAICRAIGADPSRILKSLVKRAG